MSAVRPLIIVEQCCQCQFKTGRRNNVMEMRSDRACTCGHIVCGNCAVLENGKNRQKGQLVRPKDD